MKNYKILSLLTIIALFWACTKQGVTGPQGTTGAQGATGQQGPIGPQGPAGTNGTNGNANVIAQTYTITPGSWIKE